MTTTGVVRDTPMLIRRDFNSYASPNMKAAVALAILSILGAVGLLGATIWVTIRAVGHRTPLVALAISSLFFTLGQIIRVAAFVNFFADGVSYVSLDQLVGAQMALDGIAFSTVIAAAMFTLWNRGSAASAQSTFYPPRASSNGITVKRVWDSLILVGLACMAIARAAVMVQVGYFSYNRYSWDLEILPYIFGWCYVGLWGVHVINLSATGFTFRTHIWRNYNVRDNATDGVVWGVWPCMLLYWGWIITRSIMDNIYGYSPLMLVDVILGTAFYAAMALAILLPAFKHDEWKPFVAKPHQTWIGASHYVGPSMQQPVFYATPAPQQLIYAVHPHQQQYAPGAMMMQVPVQGGYIQGHFVPTTAVQPQPVPTAQPAFASPGSSGADLASKNNLLASGTPGPGSDPNMS